MLRITDISYSVAGRPLIDTASATIPEGHKVGIVGRNGAGKTTLFRLIRGELTLDTGTITLPPRARSRSRTHWGSHGSCRQFKTYNSLCTYVHSYQ